MDHSPVVELPTGPGRGDGKDHRSVGRAGEGSRQDRHPTIGVGQGAGLAGHRPRELGFGQSGEHPSGVAGVAADHGEQFLEFEALFFRLDIELGQKARHLLHGHPVAALARRRLELDLTRLDTETLVDKGFKLVQRAEPVRDSDDVVVGVNVEATHDDFEWI